MKKNRKPNAIDVMWMCIITIFVAICTFLSIFAWTSVVPREPSDPAYTLLISAGPISWIGVIYLVIASIFTKDYRGES